jgi:ribonuclease Y
MVAFAAERAAAAEQALAAAQSLLAEQAAAADRNTARAQALAVAEADVAAVRESVREHRLDLDLREQRLADREQRLDAESLRVRSDLARTAQEGARLDQRASDLADHETRLAAREAAMAEAEAERVLVLERVAGLTAEQARLELVATVQTQAKRAAAASVRAIEREAEREADSRARRIVTLAVQRVASEQTAESAVTVLHLPSDDMKGRIIGREGRNIRAFEAVTGVNLIIDDTPEAVVLSCFDPVRREIGRLTLESLVLDGRIHPHRIEEVHERSRGQIDQVCRRAAEDALVEVGITDVHPEIVELLGRLKFRTSYGQNVLGHLVETAHIAGMMAAELGLDVTLVKRGAFLHDIGKALTHETEGSHAAIGADVARRCGEHEDVVHAIEAHHNEIEVRTLEAVLTQAADAVSGGRPGARRESLEAYVKRLQRLEEIAAAHEGVEKVFAMQAGREVRVMVLPDRVDDIGAQVLARDIVKQVEEELTYPGQIKVTVVRESRATEVAR